MLYCSWDMTRDRCNCCFSLWAIFCPFTPLTAPKMKISKNEKTPGDIILHKCTKIMIICYTVPEIWHMTHVIIFHFGLFFVPFYSPNSPKNENFKKLKTKKSLEMSPFYMCVPKFMIRWCTVPEIRCAMDRWTNRRKKWHIEVGAPPKKTA